MRLGGYNKLTLQDYPGHVAAICFTVGCQLRCPYCHNAALVLPKAQKGNIAETDLTSAFLRYLAQRKNQLTGVVVSGGEPLLQKDILDFLHKLKALGLEVKLDTNGLLPERLKEIIDEGLVDYVALDYKNCEQKWGETIGLQGAEQQRIAAKYYSYWLTSLACLREKKVAYELRTTVVRELHSLDVLKRMAELLRAGTDTQERWFLQSFVKSGPIMCDYIKIDTRISAYSEEEMKAIRDELLKQVPGIQLR